MWIIYVISSKSTRIRAEYAGSGKSYCCEHMLHKGHKLLFVCPTNVLAQNYEENGITLNKFFSIGVTEVSKMAKFDDSPYDTVVFDEIFFYNIRNLTRMKRYCEMSSRTSSITTNTSTTASTRSS